MVSNILNPKLLKFNNGLYLDKSKGKAVEIVKLPSPISACLSKEVLEKSKFFGKDKKSKTVINTNARKSYAQTTSSNVSDIHRIINNIDKTKPHIKMTTKGPLCKQIIIPISKADVDNIMVSLADHVTNINRCYSLKS